MASLTQSTWVWVNSGSWSWTGRPRILRPMVSQRVRHDWATELNWTEYVTWKWNLDVQRCDSIHHLKYTKSDETQYNAFFAVFQLSLMDVYICYVSSEKNNKKADIFLWVNHRKICRIKYPNCIFRIKEKIICYWNCFRMRTFFLDNTVTFLWLFLIG